MLKFHSKYSNEKHAIFKSFKIIYRILLKLFREIHLIIYQLKNKYKALKVNLKSTLPFHILVNFINSIKYFKGNAKLFKFQ